MRIVPFRPEHALAVRLQPMQVQEGPPVGQKEAEALASQGRGYSAIGDDGTVYAVAGILPQWEGRAIAWALIAYNAGPHMLRITREIRKFLNGCGFERIEASVDALFPAAARWVEMLGFERETPEPMRRYGPTGRPAYLYARVTNA
jgi:hypothetical protein